MEFHIRRRRAVVPAHLSAPHGIRLTARLVTLAWASHIRVCTALEIYAMPARPQIHQLL